MFVLLLLFLMGIGAIFILSLVFLSIGNVCFVK